MSIRELIYQGLFNDTVLNDDLGVGQRVYPSGSLGIDPIPADPPRPYIQWGFGAEIDYREVRETGRTVRRTLSVWVYDERGSYLRIQNIHDRLRYTLEGLTGQVSPSGVQCTECSRTNLGGDLTDNVRNLGVKLGTYRLVAQ
jgi:hypothetical protein